MLLFAMTYPETASAWSIQHVPTTPGATDAHLSEVSCTSNHACTAVGNSSAGPLIERWNGHQWSIQTPAPVPTGESASLLRRVVHFDTFCVSVGRLDAVEAVGVPYMPIPPLAERWNGSAWSIQGTVGYSGSFTAVSCSQIVCMAVGVDDSSEPQVERWDGQEWSSVIWAAEFFETTVSRTSRGFCAAMGVGPYLGARPGEVVDCTTAALGRPGRWSVEPLAGCLQLGADSVSCTSATGCTAALGGSAIYGWNGRRWMIERNALQSTEKSSLACHASDRSVRRWAGGAAPATQEQS